MYSFEEEYKDYVFKYGTMNLVLYRECHVDHVKSGALYDVYCYSCCGYEYSESKTDTGASEIPLNFCPNCGAKVVEKEDYNEQ